MRRTTKEKVFDLMAWIEKLAVLIQALLFSFKLIGIHDLNWFVTFLPFIVLVTLYVIIFVTLTINSKFFS